MVGDSQPEPLDFVLLADSTDLPKWQIEALQLLLESRQARLRLVIVRDDPDDAPPSRRRGWRRVFGNRRLLWNLYNRIAGQGRARAMQTQRLESLGDWPVLKTQTLPVGKFGEAMPEETLAKIREIAPDFILRFGFGILRGEILNAARRGVWSFHHGDPERVRGVPPGFWECYGGESCAGVILQRLSEKLDAGDVLHRGYFKVAPQSYSATLDTLLMGAAHFPARVCAELVSRKSLPKVEICRLGPVRYAPGNVQMLAFFTKLIRVRFANLIRFRFRRQAWNIAVVDAPIPAVAGLDPRLDARSLIGSASWMEEKADSFRADPFPYASATSGADLPILFESYRWDRKVGTIAGTTFVPGRGFSPDIDVLTRSGHLSYPFTLKREGQWTAFPENAAEGGVRGYLVEGDALREIPESHLFSDLPLLDSTFIEWGGLWWMFASINGRSVNTELHLFYAQQFDGPWHGHHLNPVKCDIRSARPAGTLFVHGNCLYRPAQDCSREYGGRILIQRIDRLDSDRFSETTIAVCEPDPAGRYPSGLHTLSAAGERTVIDGCRLAWRMP